MITPFFLTALPADAFVVRHLCEFYVLSMRKKKVSWENMELFPVRYLAYSEYSERYYIRHMHEDTDMEAIRQYIERGWVYIWPDELQKESIRKEVVGSKLSYRNMQDYRTILFNMEEYAKKEKDNPEYLLKMREYETKINDYNKLMKK